MNTNRFWTMATYIMAAGILTLIIFLAVGCAGPGECDPPCEVCEVCPTECITFERQPIEVGHDELYNDRLVRYIERIEDKLNTIP